MEQRRIFWIGILDGRLNWHYWLQRGEVSKEAKPRSFLSLFLDTQVRKRRFPVFLLRETVWMKSVLRVGLCVCVFCSIHVLHSGQELLLVAVQTHVVPRINDCVVLSTPCYNSFYHVF